MTKIHSVLALTAAVALVICPNAFAAMGRTPGQFAVSSVGSAQYSIPIWTPPGPRGIQPNLALTYDSHMGIGVVGVGWSVSGLGAITRCNKTYAQDSTPAAVALVTSDGYCLNGNRLRLTSGSYGLAGSTYQTEIADFSNITANGAAGNGPAYFTVQGRNGLTYQYGYTDANGNGVNSLVLASGTSTGSYWLLSKISDRSGNNLVVNYTALTGTAVLNTILWTPTSAGAATYSYKVQFNYTTNAPQSSLAKYIGGTAVTNTELLQSIAISYDGTVIRDYFLGYQASPTTGRDELKTVTQCADAGESNCLLATTVAYQPGAAGVSTTGTTISGNFSELTARYDLNGDGYPDLVYAVNSGAQYVQFGSATGYGTAVSIGASAPVLIGRLTGNRADGVLANNGGTWWYYTWNGSAFVGASTGVAYDTTAAQFQLADVDGDGLPDLVSFYQKYNALTKKTALTITTQRNTSNGSTLTFNSTVTTAFTMGGTAGGQLQTPDFQYAKLRRFDFNGDGRDDLALEAFAGPGPNYAVSSYELISTGTAFTATQVGGETTDFTPPFYTNWNDDACTDFVYLGSLYISACNGTVGATYPVGNVVAALDWDGDGRTDLLVANGSTLGVYLSTGGGVNTLLPTSIPYTSTCQYVTMDVDADGLDDLGCWSQTGTNPLTSYVHNGAGQPPDLVSSISDGYGVNFSPTYIALSRASSSVYNRGTSQVYPEQDYVGPYYVVPSATASDGIGGAYTLSYVYAQAVRNVQGRGFQGFGSIRTGDSRNGLYRYVHYYTAFPSTGMIFSDGTTQPNTSKQITNINNHLATLTLDSTANNERYFPYFDYTTTNIYEVGGAQDAELITTSYTYNGTPDNYGNFTNVKTTLTDNDTASPYYNSQWTTTMATTVTADPGTWCLNLPTEVDVTKTAPGVPSLTRHTSYTPDYTNCRETGQVVEPSSSLYKVTTVNGFDSFGNINSQAITGVGMPTRTSTMTWGTTGQFPSLLTNALNQQTQQVFDPNTGHMSSVKDPNGITTSWQYDGFARKINELRPDGTSTTWAYNNCATAGCLNTINKMTVVRTTVNTDSSTFSIQNSYLDLFDRTMVTSKLMANGNYDRNEVDYDNLGHVHLQLAPCVFNACTRYVTTNTYDLVGRMVQSQRPISASNSNLQTTTYGYQGRTSTVTDAQGKVTTTINQVTGSAGRAKDANGYYVSFNNDAFGAILSVTDSLSNTLKTTTYGYGIQAFPVSSTDVDLGARTYTVDALGELTSYKDAKSQTFSMAYDALSRPTTRTEPDLTTTWTWGTSASSYNIGKLASVSTSSSAGTYSDAYTFNSIGQLSQRYITLPTAGTLNYTYYFSTITGQLQSLKYPSIYTPSLYRLTVNYVFTNGVLTALRDQLVPTTIFWQANSFNARGQVTEETTTDLSGDPAIVTEHNYDAVTGWVGAIQTGVGSGAALQNESYAYDYLGNVTQRQNNNAGLTENFYYDNVYRLDHSTLGGTTNLQMTYDGGAPGPGNITARTDVASNTTWTYDPVRKHAVTQAGTGAGSYAYTYDGNGNVSSRNGTTFTWTSYNYPNYVGTSSESASFDYGADRQRWRMIYNGPSGIETTYYATPLFEQVVTSSGTDYRHYVYAGNKPVLVISHTSAGAVNVRSLLADHEGSVSSIVANATGTSIVSESFTAFGNRREASTWTGSPTSGELTSMNSVTREGYTFQTVLGSMGLNHMNGRVQDAITGRFLSPDPTTPAPSNTQGWNRYSYVGNNPLSYTDPTGFDQSKYRFCIDACSYGTPGPFANYMDGGGGLDGLQGTYASGNLADGFNYAAFNDSVIATSAAIANALDQLTSTLASAAANTTDTTTTSNGDDASTPAAQSAGSAQSQASGDQLPEITVTAQRAGSEGLIGTDYMGAGLATYSALTDQFYTTAGLRSGSLFGIRYGLPALLSDIPGGVGGVIGVYQTASAYNNGNYLGASQAGGATLGGIAGAEGGAAVGALFGPFDVVTIPVGTVIGGVAGAYYGGRAGASIYNTGFMPLDAPLVPPPPPAY